MQAIQPDFQVEPSAGEPVIAIAINATAARRSVTGWVGSNVADMLMASIPTLVLTTTPPYWRVPVVLSSSRGIVGQVGVIAVNAQTGVLNTPPELVQQLREQALTLAANKI